MCDDIGKAAFLEGLLVIGPGHQVRQAYFRAYQTVGQQTVQMAEKGVVCAELAVAV